MLSYEVGKEVQEYSFCEVKMTQERIRLLYLITEYCVGGAEKAMVRIVSRLDKSKYDITVAALRRGDGRLLPELEKIGVRIEILGARGKYDVLRVAFRLYNLIKELKTQVLVCSLFHPMILGRFIGKISAIPVIVNWEHNENFGGSPRLLLNRITVSFSNKIICDSKRVGTELKKCLHIPDNLIAIVPIGGIDLTRYRYQQRDVRPTIAVGSVGYLIEQKGYIYLIEAAKMVLEEKNNVNFSIVGDGSEFNNLQELIRDLSLSEKVKLLGFRSDIPNILPKWDIYVQPSLWEGLCITVVEAMASGLPVVATSVGGIPESVVNGYNGFLVSPRDPEMLANKILQLVDNPDQRIQMGRRSREIAVEKYSLDKMVRDIEEVIGVLIREKIGLVWNQNGKIWESGNE